MNLDLNPQAQAIALIGMAPFSEPSLEHLDMRDLNYTFKQMCQRNKDGSYATQADRARMLSLMADQLRELGYILRDANSLKPKHVEALMQRWQAEGLSAGTIKNRAATLRWVAQKIGKDNIVPRANDTLGIARRQFVTNQDKGKDLSAAQLARIACPYVQLSLRLEASFGLRREESIKIQPAWADKGNALHLKQSWTKGGRAREIPIRTEAQRAVLDEAKRLAAGSRLGSLIPEGMRYRDQLQVFRSQCQAAGIHGVHGLRHRYAQQRYQEMTGRACPAAGGPSRQTLNPEQRQADIQARMTLSAELGHARLQVVAIYLGS